MKLKKYDLKVFFFFNLYRLCEVRLYLQFQLWKKSAIDFEKNPLLNPEKICYQFGKNSVSIPKKIRY